MNFILKNRTMLMGLAAVVLAIGGYYMFSGGSSDGEALLTTGSAGDAQSEQLLQALSDLQTVTLDSSTFEDEVFLSLNDFGVSIPLQFVGRRNPFAPVGGAGNTSTSSVRLPGGGR